MADSYTPADNAALLKEVNEIHKHKKRPLRYHHALPAVLDDRHLLQIR